jgi:hypothetical protein
VSLAVLVTIFSSINSQRRPLWVFVLLALIPGIVLAQRFALSKEKYNGLLLIQIAIFAFGLVISGVKVFPYNGGDTWVYLHDAETLLNKHQLQALSGAYHDYPLYPAYLAVYSLLTTISTPTVAQLFNVLVAIVCVLLFYSLSRDFNLSQYHSMVIVLLLLGSKWFVYWLMMVVSMTAGSLFVCLLIVFLFRRLTGKAGLKGNIIVILIASITPFYHPIHAVAVIVLIIGYWILEQLFQRNHYSLKQSSLMSLFLYIVVFTLTQWMYYGDFIFNRTILSLANAIFSNSDSTTFLPSSSVFNLASSFRDPYTYNLDQLSFYFLFSFSLIETVRQVRLKDEPLNLYSGILGFSFLLFGFSTQILSFQAVLPHRWLLFGSILLVFPASSTFVRLLKPNYKWGRIIAVVSIVLYFFSSLSNTEANRDRPFYSGLTKSNEK